jgi:hypothetical protein
MHREAETEPGHHCRIAGAYRSCFVLAGDLKIAMPYVPSGSATGPKTTAAPRLI